jgi:cytochrome c oxidase subunit III
MDLANRRVLDVSNLPNVVFGNRNITWLANVLFMTIEGTMFALILASYFYLRTRSSNWPPIQSPPALTFGIANTIVFLVSLLPARLAQKSAPEDNIPRIRLALGLMAVFGVVAMFVRIFEFSALNCRWSDNAYASTVWVLLGMHSGHLITEWIETLTLLAISFTNKMEGTRLADVAINSDYWYFVVITGGIVNFTIYATTRFI